MTFETSSVVAADGTARPARTRLHNIAELRLIFASAVMVSHAAKLLGDDQYRWLRVILNSDAAVQGFFILSGYLVFGSYGRLRTPGLFYKRRLLRIFPAYAFAVLFFIALGLAQALVWGRTIAWEELPRYLAANLSTLNFLQPTLSGVFAGNELEIVNGALWSIKVEIMFYAVLPLLFLIGERTSFMGLSAVLIVMGTAWWPALSWFSTHWGLATHPSFQYQLPGQLHFFALGIALYAWSTGKLTIPVLVGLTFLAVALLAARGDHEQALQVLVLVALIGGISKLPQAKDRFGGQDLSYGVYLSHFPIAQLLLVAGAGGLPFPIYLGLVVGLALGYAVFSWRCIEKPSLALGR